MYALSYVLDLVRAREGDRIRRRIEIGIVVSLLIHAAALFLWVVVVLALGYGVVQTAVQATALFTG